MNTTFGGNMKHSMLKKFLLTITLSLVLALGVCSNTLVLGAAYIRDAWAKAYEAEKTITPYEFTSTSQWSKNTNYTAQPLDDSTVDAFSSSNTSVDLVTLEKAGKPAVFYDNSTTEPAPEGEERESDIDTKVMMIDANNAQTKQLKDVKDDDNNLVYLDDEYVLDELDAVKFYSASEIDVSNPKYVPAEDSDGEENQGKYKEKKVKQELKDIYYYYQSTSISLEKNKHYVLSIWLYSQGDAKSTLVLKTSNDSFKVKIENMASAGEWKKYYLFFETNSETTSSSTTFTVYANLYFGTETTIRGSLPEATENITGTLYFDCLEIKTISALDYNAQTINGVAPSETNKNISSATNMYYYTTLVNNSNFEDALEDYAANGYSGTDYDNANWKYYIPEYESGSTTNKLSTTTINKYKEVYENYSTISRVAEVDEFKYYILDEDGEKTYDAADTEHEHPLTEGYNTFNNNNHALKIENNSQLYSIGLVTKEFTVKQFMYYRISFWVKAGTKDSTASPVLFGKIPTGKQSEGLLVSKTITPTSIYTQFVGSETEDDENITKTADINNNWKQVVFYVHANSYRDMTIQLALLADKNSTIYYDNIVIESILSEDFSNAASTYKLELSPTAQTVSKSISNGYFDSIKVEKYNPADITAPYVAQNWNVSDKNNSKDVVAGIVPTNEKFDTIKANIGNPANPNGTEGGIELAKNNVYAIYAPSEVNSEAATHNYKMVSNSFSLSSNSIYRVRFQLKFASNGDSKFIGKVKAYLTYSDKTIGEFIIDIPSTYDERDVWQMYTFAVRTGSTSKSTTITFEIEDAVGTIFIKNVGLYALSEVERTEDDGTTTKVSVDTQFEELLAENDTEAERLANRMYVIDYVSFDFTMHSTEKATKTVKEEDGTETVVHKDYYESFSHYVVGTESTGEVGVAKTSNNLVLSDSITITSADLVNSAVDADTVLVIFNSTALSTKVTSNNTYTLAKSNFYTIELYVKTSDFEEGRGLNIIFNSIGEKFENINTTGETDNNGYSYYRAIVRTGDSALASFTVDFELGTSSQPLMGYALISNIKVTKLADENAYNDLIEGVDENDTHTTVKSFYTEPEESNSEATTTSNTLVTFFLVFSSLLLVVAIVIALVAVFAKRHPKKKVVVVNAQDTNNFKATKQKQQEKSDKDGFI